MEMISPRRLTHMKSLNFLEDIIIIPRDVHLTRKWRYVIITDIGKEAKAKQEISFLI